MMQRKDTESQEPFSDQVKEVSIDDNSDVLSIPSDVTPIQTNSSYDEPGDSRDDNLPLNNTSLQEEPPPNIRCRQKTKTFKDKLKKDTENAIKREFGEFTEPWSPIKINGGPRVGLLQINGNPDNLKKFVYVPENFDFTLYPNMQLLLKQLDGVNPDKIDNVFLFPTNYSVVPSQEKKTLEDWRMTFQSGSVSEMLEESFPDPSDPSDNQRIRRTKEDMRGIFSTISAFENTIFLMTNPFKGNMLSELALDALRKQSENTTVKSIGLFHTGDADILDGRLTTVYEKNDNNDETFYTQEMKKRLQAIRDKKEKAKFCAFEKNGSITRIPIPDEIFQLNSVSYSETPTNVIRVECKLTEQEKEYRKNKRGITCIPGGLAKECDHILVFTSKKRMWNFEKHFCGLHPTSVFACGGSNHEFQAAMDAVESGKPVLSLENSGFLSDVFSHFFDKAVSGRRNENAYNEKRANFKNLSTKINELVLSKKQTRKNVRNADGLLYERKLKELVNSIHDYNIYEISDDDHKIRPFNRSAEQKVKDHYIFSSIPEIENTSTLPSSRKKKESNNSFLSVNGVNRPTHALLGARSIGTGTSSPSRGERSGKKTKMADTNSSQSSEEELHCCSRWCFSHPRSKSDASNTHSSDARTCQLQVEKSAMMLRNVARSKYIYFVIERKNHEHNPNGWIMVEVPELSQEEDISMVLEATKKMSNLVNNFMNYPEIELEIDHLISKAEVPIIGITIDGSILNFNPHAKEILGDIKKNEKIESFLLSNLEKHPGHVLDGIKKGLEKFFELENQNRSVGSFSVDFNKKSQSNSDSSILRLQMNLILRRNRDDISNFFGDRDKNNIIGAFVFFRDMSFERDVRPLSALPSNINALERGEVLLRRNGNAISNFNSNAFHLIKREETTDSVKDQISRIMSTVSDQTSELDGSKRNNEAIDECLQKIIDAKLARKRYSRHSILLQSAVQILIFSTTVLSVLPVYCDPHAEGFCKDLNQSSFSYTIIVLPIVAGALQSFIFYSRPRWKSARLLLLKKRLKSELFKFRTRVGDYDAFDSKKKGLHDNVREKFVDNLNRYVDDCMTSADIKSGTLYASMNLYDKIVKPCIKRMEARKSRTSDGDVAAINNDRVLPPQILPWFRGKKRRWKQLKHAAELLKRTERRNLDIEAQLENGQALHLTEEEKDLLQDLKEAADRRAELRKRKHYLKKHRILDIDDYREERLLPQYKKFKHLVPRLTLARNSLQGWIVIFTSIGTVLGAVSSESAQVKHLIPISLVLAAVLDNFLKFFQLETKVPVLNQYCINELDKALREMNSPSTLKRRLPTQKEKMVLRVEQSILAYFMFIAEEQLSEGRQTEETSLTQPGARVETGSQRAASTPITPEANNQTCNARGAGEM